MNASQLIQRFEEEVTFDAHWVRTKVSRSEAAVQLREMGRSAFADIARHLQEHHADPMDRDLRKVEVRIAWTLLLASFASDAVGDRPESREIKSLMRLDRPTVVLKRPGDEDQYSARDTDLGDWIRWAQRHATTG